MLPTPPMITTISAFMVNTTPIEALKVRNMLISTPRGGDQRAAEREGEGRRAAHVDRDELGRDRIDRDRAHAVPPRVRVSAR